VQKSHDLLVDLADHSVRPLSLPDGFLPPLRQSRWRDPKLLGGVRLWHVEIFCDVDVILSSRDRNQLCVLAPSGGQLSMPLLSLEGKLILTNWGGVDDVGGYRRKG